MHEQEYPNKATLNEVNEVDGSDDEFRPATNDMFEFKECKHIHFLSRWKRKTSLVRNSCLTLVIF